MNSYTAMKNKLLPMQLYSLKKDSTVCRELRAYATGINILFDTLDEMTKECFIDTAQTYGITQREKLFGSERNEYDTDKRRTMLKDREQTIGLACTPAAFKKIIQSYGLSNFEITEKFSAQEVVITVHDSITDEMKNSIRQSAALDFPSHLIITVTFA